MGYSQQQQPQKAGSSSHSSSTSTSRVLTWCSILVGALSILLGVFLFSTIPTKLGFHRWLASRDPKLVGTTPANHYGLKWQYTFEELYYSAGGNGNKDRLKGQNAIVTGGNSGIGYEISLALARLGAHVTLACRNEQKCADAVERIRSAPDCSTASVVDMLMVDTNSLATIKPFVDAYVNTNPNQALDMLYLNAGMAEPKKVGDGKCVGLNQDGIEEVFATNYLGHHLLYRLLEPMLQKSKTAARVIQTSSLASFTSYSYRVATDLETLNGCRESYANKKGANKAYGQSKLAQILWSNYVTKRNGPESNIYANSFSPGRVFTPIWDKGLANKFVQEENGIPWIARTFMEYLKGTMWTAEQGALTGLFLGVEVDRLIKENIRGQYFHPQSQRVVNDLAMNETLQKELWDFSERLVEQYLPVMTTQALTTESVAADETAK
jgi:NAD(P)-dependent dehydrogenase (short-subunit alcohol dehydrogenase family)